MQATTSLSKIIVLILLLLNIIYNFIIKLVYLLRDFIKS